MARPKRIDLPFSLFHVFSRTISREKAFMDVKDQRKFLGYLAKYADLYSFRIHGWCLMSNHFHLLLESGSEDGLSKLMHRLLTAYTVYYNRRHVRHGHLFQGRFKSLIVDKPTYLLAVSRYIHLNPVKERRSEKPEKFRGSSLRFFVDGGEPEYLYTGEILKWFGGNRERYAEYVRDGMDEEIKPEILRQRYVGGEVFAERTKRRFHRMEKRKKRLEKRDPHAKTKEEDRILQKAGLILKIVSEHFKISEETILNRAHARDETSRARKILIYLLRENLPWTIRQIGDYMGLSYRCGIHFHLKEVHEKPGLRRISESLKKKINRHK